MKDPVLLVGKEHPVAKEWKEGSLTLFPWEPPPEPFPLEGSVLLFIPPPVVSSVEQVLSDLEIPYLWLKRWVPLRKEKGGVLLYLIQISGIYGSDDLFLGMREGGFLSQMRTMAFELSRYRIRSYGIGIDGEGGKNPLKIPLSPSVVKDMVETILSSPFSVTTGELLHCGGGIQITRAGV